MLGVITFAQERACTWRRALAHVFRAQARQNSDDPASLPQSTTVKTQPEALLDELTPLLDHRRRSDQAGKLVADFLYSRPD